MVDVLSYSILAHLLTLPVGSIVVVKKLGYDISVEEFMDVEADFGPRIDDEVPLSGFLFASKPIDGCQDVIPLPESNSSAFPFISLIKRGNCSFSHKVMAAKAGGYIGAIIFNNISDDIFHMSGDDDIPVPISSVMVGLTSGNRLKDKYCFSLK
ncbi:hypothetical protein FBUS_10052 [Fasciolopsis buskii]|uniref:PA domain-containing protein n=1 Tax=Fasciolopsis buskii TaxID=27845 RepID=A0A8E0RRA2_9TREM|nr:hypothetical protein FBUS_10052 [Fasciolopsis buski]